jgi:hypothetical protein
MKRWFSILFMVFLILSCGKEDHGTNFNQIKGHEKWTSSGFNFTLDIEAVYQNLILSNLNYIDLTGQFGGPKFEVSKVIKTKT